MTSRKKQKKQKSPLPSQYEFVSHTTAHPVPSRRPSPPGVRDYPPPQQLFRGSGARTQSTSPPLHQPSPPTQTRQPRQSCSTSSTSQNSRSSSQAQDSASTQRPEAVQPPLYDELSRLINELISQPNRGPKIPFLSPTFETGTIWFGHDNGKLTRRITKIFTKKFDAAYYSWRVVPQPKRETLFVEFAKTHSWDKIHSGIVQEEFEAVCKRRWKDMVSKCRTSRKRPTWIHDTLWDEMTAFWDTAPAKEKSKTASGSRMSERNGLGPHKHNSGPKSFQQIEDEMVEELGRPVSLGEVFIRTHTKKDGTFVDLKAQQVAELYLKNKDAKLTELEPDNTQNSEGINVPQLSLDEDNEIFLLSTFTNERGEPYGIGSLQQTLVNGKRKFREVSTSTFLDLKQQLKEAHRKIEEQVAINEAQAATIAEQSKMIRELALTGKFLAATDPRYTEFIATHSTT